MSHMTVAPLRDQKGRIRKPTRAEEIERFHARVAEGSSDECWPWLGGTDGHSYGWLRFGGKLTMAHRLALELAEGPIQPHLVVRHKVCDNPPCCNPAYLAVGTPADNSADMVEHGRQTLGARNPSAKLCDKQVQEIRHLLKAGHEQAAVAEQFGVRQPTISEIARRVSWRHLP